MKIWETLVNKFNIFKYIFIFSIFRIFVILMFHFFVKMKYGHCDMDVEDLLPSIVIGIISIILTSAVYCYSQGKLETDTVIDGILISLLNTCSTEIIMFIIPLISKIIPPLGMALDMALMISFVNIIVTGIIWGLSTFGSIITLSLLDIFSSIKNIKIYSIIIVIILNFLIDKINIFRSMRKSLAKKAMGKNLFKKGRKW